MKNILISSLLATTLFACGGSDENTITQIIDETKRIEINEDNASELIELTSGFDLITQALTDTRSNRSNEKMSTACAISGEMEESFSDNSNGSFEMGLRFIDCLDEDKVLQNGTLTGKGTVSDDLSSASITLTGDMRTLSADNYINIDITMTINGDLTATKITYELDYDIAFPDLIGEIQVTTNPNLTIDSNNNLSGEVLITGKDNSKIKIVYDINGVTHYLNDEIFIVTN